MKAEGTVPESTAQKGGADPFNVGDVPHGNNYGRPEGQNVGNFLTDRPSSRVLAAPGGASQIFFGEAEPAKKVSDPLTTLAPCAMLTAPQAFVCKPHGPPCFFNYATQRACVALDVKLHIFNTVSYTP